MSVYRPSSEFAYFDAMRLYAAAALITKERMIAAGLPGWKGMYLETEDAKTPAVATDLARATCYGRAMTFDPDATRQPYQYDVVSTALDGGSGVYRRGWHFFDLHWQVPGPNGYHHKIIREVLRACDEAAIDNWEYLTGGDPRDGDGAGVVWRTSQQEGSAFLMITRLRVKFSSGAGD